MKQLQNRYIVTLVEHFETKDKINIIMEWCENGDLGIYLKK